MSLHSLINASKEGDLKEVELLISEGNSMGIDIVNEKDNFGETPLHWASYFGHLKVAELLISKGKSMGIDIVNEKDNFGETPLHTASSNGHVELMISKRKSMGIDIVNERNNRGGTPLHFASRNGYLEVVELLISEGANYQELMEEYEKKGEWDKREKLERIVIDIGIDRVKMIQSNQ